MSSTTWGGVDMPGDVLTLGNDVELDCRAYELRRSGRALKMERIPMEILLLLVERKGQLVTREDIIAKIWGKDVFLDTDNSINTAVRKIRQVLKDDRECPLFIQTITGKGYRFIAEVSIIREGMPPEEESASGTVGRGVPIFLPANEELASPREEVVEPLDQDAEVLRAAHREPERVPGAKTGFVFRRRRLLPVVALCVAGALLAAWFRPLGRLPQIKRVRQITHIGTVVNNQNLLVTSSGVYFVTSGKSGNQLNYVPLDGDAAVPVQKPFPATEFFDLLPFRNEFLVGEVVHGFSISAWRRALWIWQLPAGSLRRVGNILADDATWSPDGRVIAYTDEPDHSLNLVDADGSNVRKLATFPGIPAKPRWSPDGKLIRISVVDQNGDGISLWQIDASGQHLIRMLSGWGTASRAWAGRWTGDGRYFLFTGFRGGKKDIWVLQDRRSLFQRHGSQPLQLTNGLLDFYLPTPSRDGKTVYAVGAHLQGQLVRYNADSHKFEPYNGGLSADYLAFSHDGKWMAYITYPDGALIRSRVDGSDRVQLTFAPTRAFSPNWSPDGSAIAFVATADIGAARRVYVTSVNGGSPRLLVSGSSAEQLVPDWFPDGQSLLLGSSDELSMQAALYAVDIGTGKETILLGTLGFGVGRVSPDGRYIAGLSVIGQNLLLYDMATGTSRKLAEFADYPNWSPDGKFIYYSTLSRAFLLSSEQTGIFRVKVSDWSVERVVPAPSFPLIGNWGIWSGLALDGSVIVLRDLGTHDIYALDADLP